MARLATHLVSPATLVVITSLAASLSIGHAVKAATLTNMDKRAHTLTVLKIKTPAATGAGEATGTQPNTTPSPPPTRKEFQLAPGDRVENVCESGCVLRLNKSADDDYIIEGGEMVSIEDGALYFDGEIPTPKTRDTNDSSDGSS